MILNAASGASGRAKIVLRGTDAGGVLVDTPDTVDVIYQNQAPSITLSIEYLGSDTWWVSGAVSDSDDDESDFLVILYNVFEMRSAVDQFGHFEFAVILDEETEGWEYAITYDLHGAQSNVVFAEVGFS
jgi:hypothetical protein